MIWTRYVRITLTDASVYRLGAVSPELLDVALTALLEPH